MFHPGELPPKDFDCTRYLGVLRTYAVIGLTLLGLLLAAFVVALTRTRRPRENPPCDGPGSGSGRC